jgi:hypothetical protein
MRHLEAHFVQKVKKALKEPNFSKSFSSRLGPEFFFLIGHPIMCIGMVRNTCDMNEVSYECFHFSQSGAMPRANARLGSGETHFYSIVFEHFGAFKAIGSMKFS